MVLDHEQYCLSMSKSHNWRAFDTLQLHYLIQQILQLDHCNRLVTGSLCKCQRTTSVYHRWCRGR
jgi:hypothetical protein